MAYLLIQLAMAFGLFTSPPDIQPEISDLQQINTEKGIVDDNGGGR
jgi:hypothetical protein